MAQDKPSPDAPVPDPGFPQSSMQEIIASISRIIDEDKRTSETSRSLPPDRSEILELTDALDDNGPVRQLHGDHPIERQAATEPVASIVLPAAQPAIGAPKDEACAEIVSAAASETAAAAFGRLEAVAAEQRAGAGPALGEIGRTLEDIVRDTLRPLLRAWLDEHLPELVERLVQKEIQRLVREARPR
jgi:uncharacterized protein